MKKSSAPRKTVPKSIKKTKKFYITTSIPYANAGPHIGHALEFVQADVLARRARQEGQEVFFLTGTDEHGDKINRVAMQSGTAAKAFVDKTSAKFKALKKALDLSYDDFIRTTDKKKHWPGAIKLFSELQKKGDIYKREYEGLYCVGCEKFITEKDLVDGECPLHKKAPEKVIEENYFFRLSRYAKKVLQAIESGRLKVMPETRKNEVISFINEGLEDVSFTRSKKAVSWGIPVKDTDQVMYVWCDALSNYISAIGYGRDEKNLKKWWPADVQLIGKDIFRFHAIYWPAMLMSAGLALPKKLYVHGFLTIDGAKMSKSIGNVVDPMEAVEKYGSDALRYYFIREIPSDGDGDFSQDKLNVRYNDDLAKGFGNFASRILNMVDGMIFPEKISPTKPIRDEVKRAEVRVKKHFDEFRLHDAVAAIFDLIKFGDAYINDKKPWQDKDQKVMADLVYMLRSANELMIPVMPGATNKVLAAMKIRNGKMRPKKIEPLFPRIDK
ncbi:MAG: class I tRNA ligase family protein [Candidatus Colwellbacteria bacterium]|nr:class I tRNA ligase family protein [Candidatus Colwellbacteria bacterium]